MAQTLQFMGLPSALESPEFEGLEIEGVNLPRVYVEPLHGEESAKLFRIFQKDGKLSRVADSAEVLDSLSEYFERGYEEAVCRTERERITYARMPKGVRIKSEPLPPPSQDAAGRIDVNHLLESPRIREVLVEIGILTKDGAVRREQHNKLIQIKNFLSVIFEVLPELRGHDPLHVVDGACGKSYLSFVLYHFLRVEWGLDARFRCVDTNERLIRRCEQARGALSYDEMSFSVSAIRDFKGDGKVGLLYSLHGCDTASDEAIAAGVHLDSKVILVVPCCHFEIRGQLRRHPLKGLTKFGLLEERFAALLTDGLRALALEAAGYDTSTFRFVTDDVSPKNTLLRAVKRAAPPNPRALQQFYELRDMFGVSPTIERLLPSVFTRPKD